MLYDSLPMAVLLESSESTHWTGTALDVPGGLHVSINEGKRGIPDGTGGRIRTSSSTD